MSSILEWPLYCLRCLIAKIIWWRWPNWIFCKGKSLFSLWMNFCDYEIVSQFKLTCCCCWIDAYLSRKLIYCFPFLVLVWTLFQSKTLVFKGMSCCFLMFSLVMRGGGLRAKVRLAPEWLCSLHFTAPLRLCLYFFLPDYSCGRPHWCCVQGSAREPGETQGPRQQHKSVSASRPEPLLLTQEDTMIEWSCASGGLRLSGSWRKKVVH